MCNIQTHRCYRSATAEHDVRGMRVYEDIEFGRRRAIATFTHRPAHQDNLLNVRKNSGFFVNRCRDIGQRTDRHECYGCFVSLQQRIDYEIDRVTVLQWRFRLEHVDTVDTGRAVDRFRRN